MWRNNVYNLWCFVEFYNILLPNQFFLQFTLFCCEISFGTIYALLHGEKFSQKLCPWRKNYKYQVCEVCLVLFLFPNTAAHKHKNLPNICFLSYFLGSTLCNVLSRLKLNHSQWDSKLIVIEDDPSTFLSLPHFLWPHPLVQLMSFE